MKSKRIIGEDEKETFYVEITEDSDSNSTIITSTKDLTEKEIRKAMASYAGGQETNSKNLSETSFMKTALTDDTIEKLAYNAQNDINKIQQINSYIDFYLNKDDIIGKTYEIIEANTNNKYQLKYPLVEGRNKIAQLQKVKDFIEDFNTQIELDDLITETIPYAYSNGNRIMYLRETKYGTYQVDKYPLGMAQISDYKTNNEPIVYLSLPDIITRITGIQYVLPTTGSILSNLDLNQYTNLEDEIKQNFPEEIYKAYLKDRSVMVKLNTDLSCVIRVNNRGKKYGLSPIFKALTPALRLEVQERSDSVDSLARGKKIIFQKISDKLLGSDGDRVDTGTAVWSHQELMRAWKNDIVLYTGAPWVDNLTYVEPKSTNEHSSLLTYYKNKVLSALGISFLSGENTQGVISSQINLSELMRVIDKISKQMEHNINKWYKYALENAGLPLEYAPEITILDSELMELELRMSLVDALFNKYGMSYKSAYEMLGMDYNAEKEKRMSENEEEIDKEIFFARETNHTFSSKGKEDYIYNNNDGTDNKDKQNQTVNQQIEKEGD